MASFSSLTDRAQRRPRSPGPQRAVVDRWKWVIWAGVITISLLAGLFNSAPVFLFVSAILGLGLMLVLIQRMPSALAVGFLFASMYLRLPYTWGALSKLSAAALVIAGITVFWVIDMFVVRREVVLHTHRSVFAALAIAAIAVLAWLAGYLPWFPIEGADFDAQLAGTGIFVLSVFAFLFGAHKIERVRDLRILSFAYLGFAAIFLVGSHLPVVSAWIKSVFLPGARGSMMWNWVTAISFSQALVNNRLKTRWRLLLFGLALVVLYTLVITTRSWVSGWAPAFATLGTIIWFRYPRLRLPFVLVGGIGALVFLQSPLWDALVQENSYSLLTRSQAYTILLEIVKVNPILGLGPSNYYWYTPLFPILGWYVEFNSHNQYIDLVAQTGVLGLLAVIWFMVEVFLLAWRQRDRLPEGFESAYAYGILGGVVGMAVSGVLGDWFLPFVYNVGMIGTSASLPGFLFMGGLLALVMIRRNSKADGNALVLEGEEG